MEAINFLFDWINWMFVIIPVGAACMVTYCALQKSIALDLEAAGHWAVKIRQTIKGAIVGLTLAGAITVIKSFYGF